MIFLGLSNPDLSELRVLDRTKQGGHYVYRRTIEDNFYGNLEKLNHYFDIFDHLQIIDTSGIKHALLASFQNGEITFTAHKERIPKWFVEYLPALYNKLSF